MKKYLLPVLIIVFLIFGLLGAFLLSQKQTFLNNHAETASGTGTISLSPATVTHYVGETFPVNVKFNTGGSSIAGISFRITYPYSGTTPQLDVVDSNGNQSNQIFPDSTLVSTGDWAFAVKTVTRASNTVTIDFSALDTNIAGYSNNTDTNLATIYFKVSAAAATNPIVLSFDATQSFMQTKSNTTDILKVPTNGSFTIIADTTAPNAVNNLSSTGSTNNSISLSWTAPTDVGPTTTVASYDLRYSTSTITALNWASATAVTGLPIPASPGTNQTFTVSGLNSNANYFFGIKSTDAVGNISNLSNIVTSSTTNPCTLNNPTLTMTPSTQTGRDNQMLTYQLNITNKNTGTCADDTYTIAANAPSSNWTVQAATNSATIATGANTSVNITAIPNGNVTNGNYNITAAVNRTAVQVGTATATYTVNDTILGFKFKLQGLNKTGGNTTVSLMLKNGGTTVFSANGINVTSDANGIYSGSIDLGATSNGTYDIYIKEPVHLQKKFASEVIASGSNNIDLTSNPLLAGDFNSDNQITIADIAKVLSVYTALTVPVNSNNQIYDINGDGNINIVDIAMALSNYTALVVPGD
ncbi:MAG TPA: fibronectin type III domain-containing protein [Patescibacteria group bacterium]|nr:fibronectin type III domain-containing protein [Patescibacteria group bacterium]